MATADWLPLADVLAWLKLTEATENAARADLCRKAAAKAIERHRPELADLEPGAEADADVVEGAVLLTARLYARNGTPVGVATFGELGAATILRSDPDIAMLCGIGRFGKPGLA